MAEMTNERWVELGRYRELFREDWQLGSEATENEPIGAPFTDAFDEATRLRTELAARTAEVERLREERDVARDFAEVWREVGAENGVYPLEGFPWEPELEELATEQDTTNPELNDLKIDEL